MVRIKEDEKKFFITCLNNINEKSIRTIINILSEFINYKRCWYLLKKWGNKGFYEYGVTMDLGWFIPENFCGEYLKIYKEWRTSNE